MSREDDLLLLGERMGDHRRRLVDNRLRIRSGERRRLRQNDGSGRLARIDDRRDCLRSYGDRGRAGPNCEVCFLIFSQALLRNCGFFIQRPLFRAKCLRKRQGPPACLARRTNSERIHPTFNEVHASHSSKVSASLRVTQNIGSRTQGCSTHFYARSKRSTSAGSLAVKEITASFSSAAPSPAHSSNSLSRILPLTTWSQAPRPFPNSWSK